MNDQPAQYIVITDDQRPSASSAIISLSAEQLDMDAVLNDEAFNNPVSGKWFDGLTVQSIETPWFIKPYPLND